MTSWILLAAVVVVAFVAWHLYRRNAAGRIDALTEKRRAGSRVVSRGELVDGSRHHDVALSLTDTTFFYESSDLEGSIDLEFVREVEYDTELATGTTPPAGKVLRLRSQSQTFEFILAESDAARWIAMLPPRGTTGAGALSSQ